jgi:chromosome segregation ATPase
MGERRNTKAAELSEDFPTVEALDEQHRQLYNLAMQFQALGQLAEAVAQLKGLRERYDALQVVLAGAEQREEDVKARMAVLENQRQTLAEEYAQQRRELDASMEEYRATVQDAQKALEEPLQQAQQALSETQRQAEQLKVTMRTQAEQAGRAVELRYKASNAALAQQIQERQSQVESLERQIATLRTQLNDAIRQAAAASAEG